VYSIKEFVKGTFLYGALRKFKARKAYRQWTPHDREMREFYSKMLSQGELCFDVGANVGNRVKIFLKLHANVIAIEPQHECERVLREIYGRNRNVTIVQKALGESEGEAEMLISNAHTISSLSPEWIESVRKSGRFSMYTWDKKQVVPVTTLDRLIAQYGMPSFIKIDVEGYEYQVIRGLSRPARMLSLEFTPEFMESTFNCIHHLRKLGDIRLNYSIGETMSFGLEKWVGHEEMSKILSNFGNDNKLFGDVYVQFQVE
jgi:FkbM family methyltransferase